MCIEVLHMRHISLLAKVKGAMKQSHKLGDGLMWELRCGTILGIMEKKLETTIVQWGIAWGL